MTGWTSAEQIAPFAGRRCHRCHQADPPETHETDCAAWHLQMANTDRAARSATKLSPTYPVTPAQAIDLLVHLRTRRPGQPPVEDAAVVVQLVLNLGWRPFRGALAAAVDALPDPGGTADLLADLPP